MAEVSECAVNECLDLLLASYIGNICPQSVGAELELSCELCDLICVTAGESYLCALCLECKAHCSADAAGCAVNENDFIFKLKIHDYILSEFNLLSAAGPAAVAGHDRAVYIRRLVRCQINYRAV